MTLGLSWALWTASCAVFSIAFALRLGTFGVRARGVWTPFVAISFLFAVAGVVYGAQQLLTSSTTALAAPQPPDVLLVVPLGLFAAYALVRQVRLVPLQRSALRAERALAAGKYHEAEGIYDHLIAVRGFRTASKAALWFSKALAQLQQDLPAEAASSCDQAIALRPRRALFWALKAIALARARRDDEAAAACERVTALPSREALSWVYAAYALQRLGRPVDALAACDRAVYAAGGDAVGVTQTTLATRAMALNALGHYQEGLDAAERALSIGPVGTRYPVRAAVARVAALAGLRRLDDARATGEQSLAAVETLLADRPRDIDAVDAKAFLMGLLGRAPTN